MEESFTKKEKLKSQSLISKLFLEGRSINQFPLKLIYIPITDPSVGTNKCGVSVPKRNFKNAVDRNKLKRLLREVYRKNKAVLKSDKKFAFMIIFLGKKIEDYTDIEFHLKSLLTKFTEREIKS